jgi:hypothetical protein
MRTVVYDLETYPNVFTACFSPINVKDAGFVFEISERRDDSFSLLRYIETLECMIGFNNMGFDWPILQFLRENPGAKAPELYEFAMQIIDGERFFFTIWNPAIKQIDLLKIHHFDNRAKSTSLKKLEFNMRATLVQDLPFPVGIDLTPDQIDLLLKYNVHDVLQTKAFYKISIPKISLREAIEPFWINASDTKLGRNYFIRELEQHGVVCFTRDDNGRKQPTTTFYEHGVNIKDVLFPYLRFNTPAINDALELFKKVNVIDLIDPQSGELTRLATTPGSPPNPFVSHTFQLDGVDIVMGLGGIHGSIESKHVTGCNILDLDVTSFYPSISIKNRVFPAHLGIRFCEVYQQLLARRLQSAKGTPENSAIKLALNSVFGSAGSPYTCFYDLAFMLAITINGQFLILSLAELLLSIPGVRLIQLNTDGITIVVPDGKEEDVEELYRAWEAATQLPLESTQYSDMWLRDVNNYIAVKLDGKIKRKGVYQHEREWHQNQSMPVVRKAAEAFMLHGCPIDVFLKNHPNPWDFMMRLDLQKKTTLLLDDGRELHGVVRYYVSPTGNTATKIMPKTRARIHGKGHAEAVGKRGEWTCTACGKVFKVKGRRSGPGFKDDTPDTWEDHADREHSSKITIAQEYNGEPINFDMRFYAGEAEKLIISERFIP